MTVVETLGSEDSRYELVDSRDALASAWRTLPERAPGGRASLQR